MNKQQIISLTLAITLIIAFGLIIYERIENIKKDIIICKSLNYDGVQFINSFSTNVECANKTSLERLKSEAGTE